jgi:Lanthionine synthetase C-like protein
VLWEPASHEQLTDTDWEESSAREAIRRIAGGAEAAYDGDALWRPHPRDDIVSARDRLKGLYLGAAGVVWALDRLARAEAVTPTRDWMPVATRLVELYADEPDGGEDLGGVVPSLWIGEAGILLVAHQLSPRVAYEQHLMTAVRANIDNPTWELMWGSPGTMLAAQFMYERTAEDAWADLWRECAARLWEEWRDDLWWQDLYGSRVRILGPAHGFAGNLFVLARGDLLDAQRRAELERRALEAISTYAQLEDGLAQWPMSLEPRAGKSSDIRTQWCHGAPGIVASLATLAPSDEAFTELLVAGGELSWRAGPLLKGAGLCHGTAGNGYAFLKLFERTGDEQWLARARKFAMHAIEQVERARQEYGQARNTLWTGDIGTAIYLLSCCSGNPSMPTLDYF